jgi:hypothetical protein
VERPGHRRAQPQHRAAGGAHPAGPRGGSAGRHHAQLHQRALHTRWTVPGGVVGRRLPGHEPVAAAHRHRGPRNRVFGQWHAVALRARYAVQPQLLHIRPGSEDRRRLRSHAKQRRYVCRVSCVVCRVLEADERGEQERLCGPRSRPWSRPSAK